MSLRKRFDTRRPRLWLSGVVFMISAFWPVIATNNAYADLVSNIQVVCATPQGDSQTYTIGWDNSNQFFANKGYIPKLFCEGGFAPGGRTVYVSDNL